MLDLLAIARQKGSDDNVGYRDLCVVIKISMLEEVSSLLEPVICYSARCGYRGVGVLKISLVNEVQCGTGTEWRDLIGQQEELVLG